MEASGYRERSPKTKILRRDDPLCGVIPNACGALLCCCKVIQERNLAKKLLREGSRRAFKDFGCDADGLVISQFVLVRNFRVIS